MHAEDTERTSRKQHIPFQVSPSPCRSRWNYSPQRSAEKASIWYLSCLLWKTNYKWHSCLAEPTLTTRGAKQAQHNCTGQQLRSEPWLSRGTMLGRKVIPTSTCRCCQSLGCSSLLQQQKPCPEREGTVFCMLANSVRSQMGTWAKGMATSHSRMAQSLLTAPALPVGLVLKPTARTNL